MRSDDLSTSIDRLCFKCGTHIEELRYTVVAHGRKLVVRRARSFKKSMHQECAISWAIEVGCTPENARSFPRVAAAIRELELIEEEGKRYLDAVTREIKFRRERIADEIHGQNRLSLKEFRPLLKENSRSISWEKKCVQVGRRMVSRRVELLPIIDATYRRIESLKAKIGLLGTRFQCDPPEGANPVGWVWKSEADLEGIACDAEKIESYLKDLQSKSKAIALEARETICPKRVLPKADVSEQKPARSPIEVAKWQVNLYKACLDGAQHSLIKLERESRLRKLYIVPFPGTS